MGRGAASGAGAGAAAAGGWTAYDIDVSRVIRCGRTYLDAQRAAGLTRRRVTEAFFTGPDR
ncbi:hypothetical protein Ahu01nite_030790 [Winogradskya humida]|uniref:Uncharacterized protein n=1 Tax=Winogradskya humida TaxID=113566 RepID=A0ABQ3ZN60_9ACTN|nr:hypothetical protein Ahu01nite_030790 [Actinoplanes humidus]